MVGEIRCGDLGIGAGNGVGHGHGLPARESRRPAVRVDARRAMVAGRPRRQLGRGAPDRRNGGLRPLALIDMVGWQQAVCSPRCPQRQPRSLSSVARTPQTPAPASGRPVGPMTTVRLLTTSAACRAQSARFRSKRLNFMGRSGSIQGFSASRLYVVRPVKAGGREGA
jgi:hypothetical protein